MEGTRQSRVLRFCAWTCFAVQTGCASMFLNGGRFADGSEKGRVIAKYKVESCVGTDGSPMQAPDAEYWLLKEPSGALALAEMDARGEGTVITNTWASADGDHFFTWVMSSGWEFVIPRDLNQAGTRIVYVGVANTKSGEVTKPTSAPSAKCAMPRSDAATAGAGVPVVGPAPAPAPASPPTPPAASAAEGPTAAPASGDKTCFPACRAGFTCVGGACVSACNPPCAASETCTEGGECVPRGGAAAPVPAPAPSPAPAPTPAPAPRPAPAVKEPAPAAPEPADQPKPAGHPQPTVESQREGEGVHGHLLIAPGLGLGLALGDAMDPVPQSDLIASPGLGLSLDAGFGLSRALVLGLWAEASFYGAGDTGCVAGPGVDSQCITTLFGVGPQLSYFVPSRGRSRPWFGAGLGYRWLRQARIDSAGGAEAARVEVLSGFELLRAQGGIDFKASNHAWIGPYLVFSVGTYTEYSIDGDQLACGGSGNCALQPVSESGEIESDARGTHQYVFLGARVLFDFLGRASTGTAARE